MQLAVHMVLPSCHNEKKNDIAHIICIILMQLNKMHNVATLLGAGVRVTTRDQLPSAYFGANSIVD